MNDNNEQQTANMDRNLVDLVKNAVSIAVMDALNHNSHPDLLTEKEAAKYLNIKPQTLSAWRHRGIGPCYSKIGSIVRYDRMDLEAFVHDRRVL